MMAERSPSERLRMASSMFESGKTLLLLSIKQQYPGLSNAEYRGLLFLHLFREDFSADEMERMISKLPDMELPALNR